MGMVTVEIDGKRYTGKLVSEDDDNGNRHGYYDDADGDICVGSIVVYDSMAYTVSEMSNGRAVLGQCMPRGCQSMNTLVSMSDVSRIQPGTDICMWNNIAGCNRGGELFEVVARGYTSGFMWIDFSKNMVCRSYSAKNFGWIVLPHPDSEYWRFDIHGLACVAVAEYDPEYESTPKAGESITILRWPVQKISSDEADNINWIRGSNDIFSRVMDDYERHMKGVINIAPCGWFGE